jgi:hypothetical protein
MRATSFLSGSCVGPLREDSCVEQAATGLATIAGKVGQTVSKRGYITGMHGVFLVAAELSARGFIVSTTSRSATGADLLVTDQRCQKAWSVQVKTNGKKASFWLVGSNAQHLKSQSYVYAFVNIRKNKPPQFLIVPSERVAAATKVSISSTGSVWYEFWHSFDPSVQEDSVGWDVFGSPLGGNYPSQMITIEDDGKRKQGPGAVEPIRNGIRMPRKGGKCRGVWDWCQAFRDEKGAPPKHSEALTEAERSGWNRLNTATEYVRWRQYWGIPGQGR